MYLFLIITLLSTNVYGHGYLGTPKARNVADATFDCPHCLAAGGPAKVYENDGYRHGMCGDHWDADEQTFNVPGEIQAVYFEGDVIELSVSISAHHLGYFDVQLCDTQDISEECFMSHQLMRVGCTDENDENCYRVWKVPSDYELGWITTSLDYSGPLAETGDVTYRWRMKLPEGVTCSHCVLRWHYYTTNSCLLYNPEGAVKSSEEFWNCADVQIRKESGELPPDTKASPQVVEKLRTEIPRNLLSSEYKDLGLYYVCPARSLGFPEHYDLETSSTCFASGMDADCDIIASSNDQTLPTRTNIVAVTPSTTPVPPPKTTSVTTLTKTTATTSTGATDTGCATDDATFNDLCDSMECESCLWFLNGNVFCYPSWSKDTCDFYTGDNAANGKYYWCNKQDRGCNGVVVDPTPSTSVTTTAIQPTSTKQEVKSCTTKTTSKTTVTSYSTATVMVTKTYTATDTSLPTDTYTKGTYELCHPRNCVNACLWEVNEEAICYKDWSPQKCLEESNENYSNANVNGKYIWCPDDSNVPPFHTTIPVSSATTEPAPTQTPCTTVRATVTETIKEKITETVVLYIGTEDEDNNTETNDDTTAVDQDDSDPILKSNSRCGSTWTNANSRCGTLCTSDAQCETAGEKCYGDLAVDVCSGDLPNDPPTTGTTKTTTPEPTTTQDPPVVDNGEVSSTRCGASWTAASQSCGSNCAVDGDCPNGGFCFADLPMKPCGGASGDTGSGGSGTGLSTYLEPLPSIEADVQGNIRVNTDRKISYLTSWGLATNAYDAIMGADIDAFLLSFGSWNVNGDIESSDDLLTIPRYDPYYLEKGYTTWTNVAYDNPESTMFIALGGATYEFMWDTMDTPARREKIAASLAKLLNTKFPVYKKGLKETDLVEGCLSYKSDGVTCDMNKYQLAGYVTIDGLDFDYERASRLTQEQNGHLEDLIKRIRAESSVNWNHNYLSLTTYHVGADPVACGANGGSGEQGCSYPGSTTHSGEVVDLLVATKDVFDFFNVMTYDAGPDFRYDVSLENYARIVGSRSKIILGITINSQWGPDARFTQTRENNLERTSWQKSNGFGGFFVWALGSNDAGLDMFEQIGYVNSLANAGS